MWTLAFWKGAGERAIKTFAQSVLAVIGVGVLGIHEVDWIAALSVAALATLASLLTSIGNADFTAGQKPVVIEHVAPAERTVDLDGPRPADVAYDEWDSMRNQR